MDAPKIAAPSGDFLRALASAARRHGEIVESVVQGTSMGASLPPGTRIRVRLEAPSPRRAGEIVAFVADARLVAHRVVYAGRSIGGARFVLTRGDARALPDPPIALEEVVGVVAEAHESGRWAAPQRRPSLRFRGRLVAPLLLAPVLVASWLHLRLGRASARRLARVRTIVAPLFLGTSPAKDAAGVAAR